MTASNLPYALYGLLIVGVFIAWFYVCWQDYAIERGREELLELRDEWFDLVTSSSRRREEAACRVFLSVLEAQAKWIHKCSLLMVALALCMPRARERSASLSIEAAIHGLPSEELRLKARRLRDDAELAVGRTMVKRSLVGFILAPLIFGVAKVRKIGSYFRSSGVARIQYALFHEIQSRNRIAKLKN